ncbi:ATP-binding protein [Sphaerisporangium viridialbum]|uniref:ATP-binding protein n=1 Tax=Sphaerisporangium viridialbum TaxID=46189 RepID=UPI003C720D21
MRTMTLLGAVDLPARTSSVPVARVFVRRLLDAAGLNDIEHVELLVSELLANAVRYSDSGRGTCGVMRLVVSDNGHALHVEVIDGGSAGAIPQIPEQVDPLQENGRGLWLVRELSSSWGWEQDEAGRSVWFEVPR